MSADVLREAAALMRSRAEAVEAPEGDGLNQSWAEACAENIPGADGEHIASWHPAVALAVAKAMDDVADAWEVNDGWAVDPDDRAIRFEETIDGGWVAVATAYLGGQS